MFTGLVDSIGVLRTQQRVGGAMRMGIDADFTQLVLGESIAVRGICLSVVKIGANYFEVEASEESLRRTNLSSLKIGDRLNLERALQLGARLGGHWVMGHVDAVASVKSIASEGLGERITLALDSRWMRYVVEKGSITLDGVSLTVSDLTHDTFSVVLIPITRETIDGNFRRVGASVNIEVDVLGKYIERLMLPREDGEGEPSGINLAMLQKNGFLR